MVITRLYSDNNQNDRFMDLYNLKSIFYSKHINDFLYVRARMNELKLSMPELLKSHTPKELQQ